MKFRKATIRDVETIIDWRWEVIDWIRAKGSDQWGDTGLTREEFKRRLNRSITAGETWMALDDSDRPVGTIAIDLVPDEGLWTDDELNESYIVHRMIVPRSHAGQGIGAEMVKFAEDLARNGGRPKLVVDVWNTNNALHRYYEGLGFRYVRTVPNHWTPSATLFEREVPNFNPSTDRPTMTPVVFRDQGR